MRCASRSSFGRGWCWGTHKNPQVPILAVSRLSGQYFAFVAEPQNGGSFVARQKPLTDRADRGQRLRSAGRHQARGQSDYFRDAVSAGRSAGDSAELKIGVRLRASGFRLFEIQRLRDQIAIALVPGTGSRLRKPEAVFHYSCDSLLSSESCTRDSSCLLSSSFSVRYLPRFARC